MSTFLIEPGAKLANRYRLDHVVSETGGATRWKATDETLARPVGVWTFADGFPRTSEVVRAARATSRIPDARVTQVFDADDSAPTPYVVEEWVTGSSLADLIAQGPMEPERAAGLVAEAAEAIAAAHTGGLHHLCLTPAKLMWSSGGAVKVVGIGVDAALLGANVADPGAVDAQGLGNLLYAALTGRWPGGPQDGLPPAPQGPAGPYPPAQVRTGLTEPLATITTRAALPHLAGQMVPGAPITSPAALCAELAEVPRLIPLPVTPAEPAPQPEPGTSRRTGEFEPTGPRRSARNGAAPRPPERSTQGRGAAAERRQPTRMEERDARAQGSFRKVLIGVVALVVFAAVVVGAWTVGSMMSSGGEEPPPDAQPSESTSDGPELVALEPTAADGFDPLGDGSEHGDNAQRAIDGDPGGEPWKTEGYFDQLGVEKSGVGLLVDLGSSREVHEVVLDVPASDYGVQIRIGDNREVDDPAGLDADLPSHWEGTVNDSETISIEGGVTGRYVVVWFTELPTDGDRYRGAVNQVEIRGVA
ncbi:protein kinase family protein [Nocardiopsis sp. FIRDI 009]|uniref:protein kinase family protein n=1 Tax=Nocardiopsis sp. FIRDI 009 TaxID=714197 RepID=UPI000E27AFD1|nr:protein kinase family protein [Nocardiopsis sp. FIRDI 009]